MHEPRSFITTVPHMSFVWGDENVNFLRARYTALQQSTLFRGMRYSEDHAQIKEWAPLVMEGRDPQQKVAATRTEIGTDVNYGEITRQLITSLQKKPNFALQRILDGKRVVLFGPFATFSTKFLKNGSLWDLLSSTTTSNFMPMVNVGLDNFDLVKYLVSQVMLSDDDRFAALQEYYPQAKKEDWRLWQAGQRVQIIKSDAEKGGVLRLGGYGTRAAVHQ